MELERQVWKATQKRYRLEPYIEKLIKKYLKTTSGDRKDFNSQEVAESMKLINEINDGMLSTEYDPKHYHFLAIMFAAVQNRRELLTHLLTNTIYPKEKYQEHVLWVQAYYCYKITEERLRELSSTALHQLAQVAGAGVNTSLIDRLCHLDEVCLNFAMKGAKNCNKDEYFNYLKLRSMSPEQAVVSLEEGYFGQAKYSRAEVLLLVLILWLINLIC
jgi:hypothetical protein